MRSAGLRGLSPKLIPLAVMFLVVGLSVAMAFPFLSLFLSTEVRATPGRITLFLVVSPIAGVFLASMVGRLSDRFPIRRWLLIGAALVGCLGATATAFVRDYWLLLALSMTAFALAGSMFPQSFAYARQVLERDSPGRSAMGVTTMRTVFSIAFVGGPPLAALLLDTGGFRLVYLSAAAAYLLAAAIAAFGLDNLPVPVRAATGADRSADRAEPSRAVMLGTVVAFVLLQTPMPLVLQALPLFIHEDLHRAASGAGVVLGVCAALEIPLMLGLGALTTRYRLRRLVLGGAACGTAYYLAGLLAPNLWVLIAAQVLNALFISAVSGLGIPYVQDMLPGEPGRATTMVTNTFPIGAAIAGPLFGLSAHFGYRWAWAMAAVLSVVGFLVLLLTTARPRPVAAGDPAPVDREAVPA